MNKITLAFSSVAIILSSIAIFSSGDDELAYVDVNKLLNGYKRTVKVREELEQKSQKLKANSDSLMFDWQNTLKKYEKERSSMSEKELKLQKELLTTKQQQVNNYQQAIQKQIQKEEQTNTQTLINDINSFVQNYGDQEGYDIILGANGSGNIMYANKGTDLTEEVLMSLNRDFSGE